MKKIVLTLLVCFTVNIHGQSTMKEDILLQIMQTELNRNMQYLSKEKVPVYVLSYRLEEEQNLEISADFGALMNSDISKRRLLTIQIRVGDKQLDNFVENRTDDYDYDDADYSLVSISLDNTSKSIQQMLWLETEKLYRSAVKKYEFLKTSKSLLVDKEDKSPNYSDAPVSTYYEKPIEIADWNTLKQEWEPKVKSYSRLFLQEKNINHGNARFSFVINRKYFVNNEGTAVVQNYTSTRLYVSGKTQADDGMLLPMYISYFAHLPAGLPSDVKIMEDVENMIKKLHALRAAPVVDAYTGPAILSNNSSGVFFHEIFGHRVEGYRLKNESDAQTFKKKVNQNVLHTDISIVFDPTINEYNTIPLNGSYVYDDEGVKSEKVNVVEKGILKNFLMTRTPIDGFPKSNGHARASIGQQVVSRQSNLIVETKKPYTDVQLRQMLIQEAKKQGKEYGYWFEQVQGGFTLTGRWLPNSFNVTPVEVYRVFVDGRPDELVRGVDLVGTPLAIFSQIEAVGDNYGAFHGVCGAESGRVEVSCCSPAVFVKQIETQRKGKNQDIAPILDRPYEEAVPQTDNFTDLAFRAMKAEIDRNMGLKLDTLKKPYYISYMIADGKFIEVNSSLGGVISSFEEPLRNYHAMVLVGDDNRNNLNFSKNEFDFFLDGFSTIEMPIENDYNVMRICLWNSSDELYKKAVQEIEEKNTAIQQQNLSEEELNLPDFSKVPIQTMLIETQKENISKQSVEQLSTELSIVLTDYPFLIKSNVTISDIQADVLYLNGEGMQYKQTLSLVHVSVTAVTKSDDGEILSDNLHIYTHTFSQLPDKEKIKEQIREMANRLEKMRIAPVQDNVYKGMVMFEGDAVGDLISKSFFSSGNGLLSKRKKINGESSSIDIFSLLGGSSDENKYEDMINKQVIDPAISITAINTRETFNGIPLIGSYKVDAEGVSAKYNLPLIKNGVLIMLLNDRIPSQKIRESNAHKRFNFTKDVLSPSLGPGVIEVTASKTMSKDKMKKQLLSMAKKQSDTYAYIIRKIDANVVGFTDVSSFLLGLTSGSNAVKIALIYRVSVADGTETLVRMASMSELTMDNFKEVIAVSSERQAINMLLNCSSGGVISKLFSVASSGIPCSFILPEAIILSDI
ncbi:MAG: metallopeptidase TldD-related protein, partial [Bacteroidales bacterium]|nr:metallopeptidase TldD-related protein [Bacteroidales bacterium]